MDKEKLLLVSNFYRAQQEYKMAEKIYKRQKKDFESAMNSSKDKNNVFGDLQVTRVEKQKIVWDTQKLVKTKANSALIKKYIVSDSKMLTKFLKKHGITKKEFLSFFYLELEVDEEKINKMFELGEIALDDIADCYTVVKQKPFYKIKKIDERE